MGHISKGKKGVKNKKILAWIFGRKQFAVSEEIFFFLIHKNVTGGKLKAGLS